MGLARPIWISAIVVIVAWLIRRHLEEPPSFEARRRETVALTPLTQTLRFHWRAVLRVTVCALINTINIYITVWAISFATNGHGLDRSTMLWVPVLANLLALVAIPIAGHLADRVGRKKVFIFGALGSAIFVYPYLYFIAQGNMVALFICGVVLSGAMYSAANAIWPSFYAEQFPTRVRATGLALGTQRIRPIRWPGPGGCDPAGRRSADQLVPTGRICHRGLCDCRADGDDRQRNLHRVSGRD